MAAVVWLLDVDRAVLRVSVLHFQRQGWAGGDLAAGGRLRARDWYVFALLSIPVVWLARRFDFESGHRRRSLAVHLPASLAFSLAYMVLRAGVGRFQSDASFAEAFLRCW